MKYDVATNLVLRRNHMLFHKINQMSTLISVQQVFCSVFIPHMNVMCLDMREILSWFLFLVLYIVYLDEVETVLGSFLQYSA